MSSELNNLLKPALPWQYNYETKRTLEDIQIHCDTRQRFSQGHIRFRVPLLEEDDLKLGDELSIDLMFLEVKAFLNVVDTDTHFSATYGKSVDCIGLAFIEMWCTIYPGFPN